MHRRALGFQQPREQAEQSIQQAPFQQPPAKRLVTIGRLPDEKDAIGRRYRRQDAIGTPYCVTVDHQSLEDQTITIRERDTMHQERIHISKVKDLVEQRIAFRSLFGN